MTHKTNTSRSDTPWDRVENLPPTQQFIRDKHKMHYQQGHSTLLESGEKLLINSYIPKSCPFCNGEKFVKIGLDEFFCFQST